MSAPLAVHNRITPAANSRWLKPRCYPIPIPFAAGPGFLQMSQAAQVKHIQLHRFGEDFAVEGYVRDPYGE